MMLINYQYRAYPDTNQKLELNNWLRVCRYWYNRQLGDRFDWWEHNRSNINACPLVCSLPELRENPNFYSQKKQLPIIKQDLSKVAHSGELLDWSNLNCRRCLFVGMGFECRTLPPHWVGTHTKSNLDAYLR